jgi:hypothetical protein
MCGAIAASTNEHTKSLCQIWIALLLHQVQHGEPTVIDRFSAATGIPRDQLNAWRRAQLAHDEAETGVANAKKAFAEAERVRSEFASMLWGAKSGCELQFAAADKDLEQAKAKIEYKERQTVEAARTLDTVSETLLRACVEQSLVVSASAEFGSDIGRVRRNFLAETQTLQQEHKLAQQKLLTTIADALNMLRSRYQDQ